MAVFQQILPFLILSGQVLVFFQVEHKEVQALMLAFIAFQVWRKYRGTEEAGER